MAGLSRSGGCRPALDHPIPDRHRSKDTMQRRAIQIPSGHPPGQPLRLPPRHREGLLPPDRRARRGGPPGPGELRPGDYDFGGAELLTLSACETAVGGAGAQGREVEGPGALAQTKGARGVLATLWPVTDASTGRFMQRLYRPPSRTGHSPRPKRFPAALRTLDLPRRFKRSGRGCKPRPAPGPPVPLLTETSKRSGRGDIPRPA
jgi:hypothetical protein